MQNELDEDRYVNQCRHSCLLLMYELCNRCQKTQTITEDAIRTVFGQDRVLTILRAAMPLDQAQCLYKMQYAGAGVFGMHWVAEQHIEAHPDVWNQKLKAVGGRSTMNKRYLWIAGLFGLPLANDPVLVTCFTAQGAPWLVGGATGNTAAAKEDDDNMNDQVDVDFEALERSINDCDTVEKFRCVYDGQSFQACLGRLRVVMGTGDPVRLSFVV